MTKLNDMIALSREAFATLPPEDAAILAAFHAEHGMDEEMQRLRLFGGLVSYLREQVHKDGLHWGWLDRGCIPATKVGEIEYALFYSYRKYRTPHTTMSVCKTPAASARQEFAYLRFRALAPYAGQPCSRWYLTITHSTGRKIRQLCDQELAYRYVQSTLLWMQRPGEPRVPLLDI